MLTSWCEFHQRQVTTDSLLNIENVGTFLEPKCILLECWNIWRSVEPPTTTRKRDDYHELAHDR